MKTIEISDELADELKTLTEEQTTSVLISAAQNFIDISELNTPKGAKVLVHELTGKKLYLAAFFEGDSK